ncbi:MAG: sulfite exporter TauE/SafE family protein [Deltaproteobacteria bacterium]|jgi:uncharacterized membrane protein YfcA|nr:sulfite exporter TauE/SafE family protein [Deltaproteobacteria bacterium]
MLSMILLYLPLGALSGIIAGLLGIGGGVIVVPILVFTLHQTGVITTGEEQIMHLALGTSFATIVITSISSALAHNRRGAVIWPIVRALSPGMVGGVVLGAFLAANLRSAYLQGFFVCYLLYISYKLLRVSHTMNCRTLPGRGGLLGAGGVIGFVSSLVGIGGGTLVTPFLLWCNTPMHKVVGTSSAIGLPIALTGAVMYLIIGWNQPGLPPYCLGYVYLPAFLGIAVASFCTAPIGSAISHRLPVGILRKLFAGLLLLIAVRMGWMLLAPIL